MYSVAAMYRSSHVQYGRYATHSNGSNCSRHTIAIDSPWNFNSCGATEIMIWIAICHFGSDICCSRSSPTRFLLLNAVHYRLSNLSILSRTVLLRTKTCVHKRQLSLYALSVYVYLSCFGLRNSGDSMRLDSLHSVILDSGACIGTDSTHS